ncbi:urease accessory protein UreD [Streptomyces sp. NPDC057302]|uniref:urease accessory protein UreD n=1 Tax=Streptomyces sp. NPDC057302 TaxID=3346094 RepID=UPI003640727D
MAPAHYEPERIPYEVRRHAGTPDTLGVGRPGKVGLLELSFEQRGARTELVRHYQKSPLQIMRPLYYDPARPDLPITQLMATGGGILQGDRLRTDLHCGPDTALHLTSQSATKLYRMECDYATQLVNLHLGDRSYVEYLPEPVIPFAGSRFYQRTMITAAPSATVLAGEVLYAGRLAYGERHAYEIFASDLELRRPGGDLVLVDPMRLEPGGSGVRGPAVLQEHDVVGTFYAITSLAPAAQVADTLHAALASTGISCGVSTLPQECGAWARFLTDDPQAATAAARSAWDAVRKLLIGVPAPLMRKS